MSSWRNRKYNRAGWGVSAYRVSDRWFGVRGWPPDDIRRYSQSVVNAALTIDNVNMCVRVATATGEQVAEIGDRVVYDGVFGWAAVRKEVFGKLFSGVFEDDKDAQP